MIEIERKFLVRSTDWGRPLSSRRIEQGYLFIAKDRNMRVRRIGDRYEMTLKVRGDGLARHEINTDIDAAFRAGRSWRIFVSRHRSGKPAM